MSKSIKKNFLYNLLYQVAATILPIITTPYLARVLGADNIGIYGYTISISAYFILFGTLGTALYGQREIAYRHDNPEKRTQSFWEIFILRVITLLISLTIFFFTFCRSGDYALYYKILCLEILASLVDISWFFQGLEEFKKTVLRGLLVKIIGIICIFIFVKTENDLNIYFLIYSLSLLIGNLSLWFYLKKFLVKFKLRNLDIIRHIKPALALFLPQIAIQIYIILDKTMIGLIIPDKSEVGYYTQGEKIIKTLLMFVTSIGTVMFSRISIFFVKNDQTKINDYIEKVFSIVTMFTLPMVVGIICITDSFVPLFFGDGYDGVIPIMKILAPILLIIGSSNVIGYQYLLPTKKQKEFTKSVTAGAIINFCANLILITNFKAIGAAIGTIVAETAVTAIQIYYTRKFINYKKILYNAKNFIISSIIMLIFLSIINIFELNNVVDLIVKIIVGICTYILVLLILKDKSTRALLKTLFSRLKKGGKK